MLQGTYIFIALYEPCSTHTIRYSTREIMIPALVEKCLGATKAGTKQKATDIILLYAEIDTPEPVLVNRAYKHTWIQTLTYFTGICLAWFECKAAQISHSDSRSA